MPARLSGPPHVLVTADAVGGVWTYALDLSHGLRQAGLRVTLAVLGPAPTAARLEAARAAGLPVVPVDGPLDWLAKSEAELRPIAAALARLAVRLGVDLLHLSSPALAGLVRFGVPVLGVCHSCLATWWRAVEGADLPANQRWRRDMLARGYAACDSLIAPSRTFAAATHAEYGVHPEIVANGRRPPVARGAKRAGFALTAGRLWDLGKGAATLDSAASMLRAPIVAVGPLAGPDGSPVRFAHLRNRGPREAAAVANWMAAAPVFASAALYEPFGLAVLEAAQTGAALVLSDIPTFRELWSGAAAFVAPGDAPGFAEIIGGLLRDPASVAQAGAQAASRARRYTVEAMTNSTIAHYRRLKSDAFALEAAA